MQLWHAIPDLHGSDLTEPEAAWLRVVPDLLLGVHWRSVCWRECMAQTQEQLKAKYQTAIDAIQQVNGSLKNVNMEGEKLFIRAEVGNDQLKDQVWNAIKQVNATYSDLHGDIIINPALAPKTAAAGAGGAGQRTYTVEAGDSLSKIAEKFYGNASEYNKIFEANRDKLSYPDHVRAGAELVIPQ
jgi:nucleoid-associated protein YgaU